MTRASRLAPFRPSSADQWFNCAGAPRVNYAGMSIPEPPKPDADEGTAAHKYLESLINSASKNADNVSNAMKQLIRRDDSLNVPEESIDMIETVVDDIFWLKTMGGFDIYAERSFTFEVAGKKHESTVDVLLVNDSMIYIIDLKWGAGVPVSVRYNRQLMSYASAVSNVYPGRSVTVGIYQPRGVGTGFNSWTIPKQDMTDFLVEANAAAERAHARQVQYTPGTHCKWCDGLQKGICPKLQEHALDVIATDTDFEHDVSPPWWLLDYEKHVKNIINKIGTLADAHLSMGHPVPGWIWSEKLGNRKWSHPDTVAVKLAGILGGDPKEYENRKPPIPITITDATKIARRKRLSLDSLMLRPTKFVRVRDTGSGTPSVKPIE